MACDCRCLLSISSCGVPYQIAADSQQRINLVMNTTFYDYDPAGPGEPLPANATQTLDAATGIFDLHKFARRTDNGEVTHVAACGTWVPIAGTLGGGVGTETVEYNVTPWTFPVNYADDHGAWIVAATDLMQPVDCLDELRTLTPLGSTRAEDFSNTQGTPVPTGMLAQTWNPYALADGVGGQILADLANPDPLTRDAVRMPFNWPVVGTWSFPDGTHTFRFLYAAPGGGNVGVGFYYPPTDSWLNISGHTKPVGAVATQHADHLQIFGLSGNPVGDYSVTFDATQVGTREPIEAVIFGVNNSNSEEDFANMRVEFLAADTGACFTWNDPTELAAWMTSINPLGATFTAAGSIITATVAAGQAALFAGLSGDGTVVINPT